MTPRLVIINILNLLDILFTITLITLGYGVEGNPVMALLLTNPILFIIVKIAVVFILTTYLAYRPADRMRTIAEYIILFILGVVVIWNMLLLIYFLLFNII